MRDAMKMIIFIVFNQGCDCRPFVHYRRQGDARAPRQARPRRTPSSIEKYPFCPFTNVWRAKLAEGARTRGKEKFTDKSQTPTAKRLPEVPGIPMRGKLWAEGNTHDSGAKKKQRKIARRVLKTILRDPFRRRC